jgi:hypothetical protein
LTSVAKALAYFWLRVLKVMLELHEDLDTLFTKYSTRCSNSENVRNEVISKMSTKNNPFRDNKNKSLLNVLICVDETTVLFSKVTILVSNILFEKTRSAHNPTSPGTLLMHSNNAIGICKPFLIYSALILCKVARLKNCCRKLMKNILETVYKCRWHCLNVPGLVGLCAERVFSNKIFDTSIFTFENSTVWLERIVDSNHIEKKLEPHG